MESITVNYSRKVSPGNYESVGIGGSIEFKPTSEDLQAEYDRGLVALKLIIDGHVAEVMGRSGGTFDEQVDLGEPPEWVGQDPERIDALLGRGPIPAPPHPPVPVAVPEPPAVVAPAAPQAATPIDAAGDSGAPSGPTGSAGVHEGDTVYFAKAKVFRSEMKRSRTGKVYGELRVGHNDLTAHIGEQYVTVRVFDPEYAAAIGSVRRMKNEDTGQIEDVKDYLIKENDFVNLWGAFSPWTSNPAKFDLNATAVQKVSN